MIRFVRSIFHLFTELIDRGIGRERKRPTTYYDTIPNDYRLLLVRGTYLVRWQTIVTYGTSSRTFISTDRGVDLSCSTTPTDSEFFDLVVYIRFGISCSNTPTDSEFFRSCGLFGSASGARSLNIFIRNTMAQVIMLFRRCTVPVFHLFGTVIRYVGWCTYLQLHCAVFVLTIP